MAVAGNTQVNSSGEPSKERIAKVIARSGLCSRREAEELIASGRVILNGETVTSPALDISPTDSVLVDSRPLPERQPPRLWRYHKPKGRVTTHKDPEGRPTVFDGLPDELPRLISVGRLDYNTEGLILLTNDGELARHLELPATGWARRYRVRAHGEVDQAALDALSEGLTIEGVHYGAVEAKLERRQGGNVWISVAIREGKNREIRRIMEHLGLSVNRLIRVSYGPFMLGDLQAADIEEVRPRVLMDQLGPEKSAALGVMPGDRRPVDTSGRPFGRPIAKKRKLEQPPYLKRRPESGAGERARRPEPEPPRTRIRRILPMDAASGEPFVEEVAIPRPRPFKKGAEGSGERRGGERSGGRFERSEPRGERFGDRRRESGERSEHRSGPRGETGFSARREGGEGARERFARPPRRDREESGERTGDMRPWEREREPRGERPTGDRPRDRSEFRARGPRPDRDGETPRREGGPRDGAERRPRPGFSGGARSGSGRPREDGERKPYTERAREGGGWRGKSDRPAEQGEFRARGPRPDGEAPRREGGPRDGAERRPRPGFSGGARAGSGRPREDGERKPYTERPREGGGWRGKSDRPAEQGEFRARGPRPDRDGETPRREGGPRDGAERRPRPGFSGGARSGSGRPREDGERKPYTERPRDGGGWRGKSDRPAEQGEFRARGPRPDRDGEAPRREGGPRDGAERRPRPGFSRGERAGTGRPREDGERRPRSGFSRAEGSGPPREEGERRPRTERPRDGGGWRGASERPRERSGEGGEKPARPHRDMDRRKSAAPAGERGPRRPSSGAGKRFDRPATSGKRPSGPRGGRPDRGSRA